MFVGWMREALLLSVLAASAMLFTGCPTPPKAPPRVTPLGFSNAPEQPVRSTLPDKTKAAVQPPEVKPEPPPVAALAPVQTGLQLPDGTLPVSQWWKECGFNQVVGEPSGSVALHSDSGTIQLDPGKRFARWNGINISLGFAPVVLRGELALRSQDVLKTLYPLARPAPGSFGSGRVLVIDPGHGGRDSGSRTAAGNVLEKDLTLDWALRIERLLANTPWNVVLTRRTDTELSLQERVALAEAHQATLFISLHFNSLEKGGSETGIETFCLTPAGLPSTIRRGYEDDLERIYPNNAFDSENLILASRIHSSLVKATGRRDRGVRRARFMTVLREQSRPAVLVEGGFLSNPAEAALILQPAFRETLARAVCDALP